MNPRYHRLTVHPTDESEVSPRAPPLFEQGLALHLSVTAEPPTVCTTLCSL